MLNELDALSEKINRLLRVVDANRQALGDRDTQLQRMRVERDEALTSAHALRSERDALRSERDALLAKIEDAQVKLNAILEKLPTPRALKDGSADGSGTSAAVGTHAFAEQEQHVEGESYGS